LHGGEVRSHSFTSKLQSVPDHPASHIQPDNKKNEKDGPLVEFKHLLSKLLIIESHILTRGNAASDKMLSKITYEISYEMKYPIPTFNNT